MRQVAQAQGVSEHKIGESQEKYSQPVDFEGLRSKEAYELVNILRVPSVKGIQFRHNAIANDLVNLRRDEYAAGTFGL
jgi:hypothetical protein